MSNGVPAATSKTRLDRFRDCFGLNKSVKVWFLDNHLLVFLFIAFVVGLALPALGRTVSGPALSLGALGSMRVVQSINVILIFLISGFRLKTDAMKKALKQPCALLTGWFSILAWTPLLGFVAARLPLGSKEFSYGLALFCCVPTTLTSGAALIAGCKGASRASELALMITVTTNLLGCFTTPLWLSAVLSGVDAEIDVFNLLVKLVVTLLLPTVFGKMLQMSSPKAAQFSKDWKTELTIFSNFNLVFVVWQSVSRAQATIATAGAGNIVACVACGIGLHLVFWMVNAPVFAFQPINDDHQKRAVFLLGSQKTLPVSLAIIAGLPEGTVGDLGLMTLPCIFGHLSQLIIDAFLVDYWAKLPTDVKAVSDSRSCVAADAFGAPAANDA
jgi:sodium/bile acid cotransporter 7